MRQRICQLLAFSLFACTLLASPARAASAGYTQTRYPIVLVHGLFGFDNLDKLNPDIYLTGHPEAPFEGIMEQLRVQVRPHPLLQQQPWHELVAERRASIEARIAEERGR